jgi:hypothetical protein
MAVSSFEPEREIIEPVLLRQGGGCAAERELRDRCIARLGPALDPGKTGSAEKCAQ